MPIFDTTAASGTSVNADHITGEEVRLRKIPIAGDIQVEFAIKHDNRWRVVTTTDKPAESDQQ